MTLHRIGWILTGLLLAACAPTIPKELVNAKTAYHQAASGKAATLAPEELADAHALLNRAEESFGRTGDSKQTRQLAADAELKADMAESRCQIVGCKMPEPKVITNTVTETVVEQKVITLPAAVLFAFDEAKLLPGAQKHLDAAVDALRAAKAGKNEIPVIVVGHTDSVGTREYNQGLSERRAAAVRDFLVAHGQDPSYVTLRAKGPDEPFTSNATQEGRANNRRVEILIKKKNGK